MFQAVGHIHEMSDKIPALTKLTFPVGDIISKQNYELCKSYEGKRVMREKMNCQRQLCRYTFFYTEWNELDLNPSCIML